MGDRRACERSTSSSSTDSGAASARASSAASCVVSVVVRPGSLIVVLARGHAVVGGEHRRVVGVGGEQLGVGPGRGDATVLDAHDPVGELDGRAPVGHHQRGHVQLVAQAVEDARLDARVDRGGGVVEHEQPGPAGERPGEGEALALTAGEGDAPLAEDRVRGRRGAWRRTGRPGRRRARARAASAPWSAPTSTFSRTVSANRNDSWNTRASRSRRASRRRRSGARPPTRMVPRSGSTRRTSSSHRVVLPQPVGPTRATISPGASARLDVGEHRLAARVGEVDAVHLDERRRGRWDARGRAASGAWSAARTRSSRSVGDHGPGHLLEEEADDAHREGEEREQRHRLHDVAGRDRALGDAPRADGEQRDDAEVRQRVERRLEERAEPADLDPLVAQRLGRDGEACDLVRLEAERLHHERAVEALVRDARDLADVLLAPRRRAARPGGCSSGSGSNIAGNRTSPTSARIGSTDDQRDHREDDQHHEPGRERQGVDDLGGGEHVGVGVGEQLAGRVLAVEVERHREEVVGDVPPQPGLAEPGGLAGEVAPGDGADRAQDRHADDQHDPEPRGRLGHPLPVNAGVSTSSVTPPSTSVPSTDAPA